jgi:hypothetical protein
MSLPNPFIYLIAVIIFITLLAGCDRETDKTVGINKATQDLTIGRMRVSIWPEHDDPSLLAIYDGRFEDVPSYPIKTSFLVPKGSVISDACSLSHEGQHFCQLYKTTNKGEYDEVSLILPYPNFYLSFHTPRFDTQNEKRAFNYQIKANHPIKTMEIDIQQPLRSSEFKISPAQHAVLSQQDKSISLVKGFKHFAYTMDDIAAGQESLFKLNYIKKDPKPSVDIKYVSMKGKQVWASPYETQKKIKTYIYILFVTGILVALAVILWFYRSRKKKQNGTPA